MNRYTAEALTAEARKGRAVLVLSHTVQASRHAAHDFYSIAEDEATEIRKANGRESIRFASGGHIRFASQQSTGIRGVSADLVFVDWPDVVDVRDFLPNIAASTSGEIVRA